MTTFEKAREAYLEEKQEIAGKLKELCESSKWQSRKDCVAPDIHVFSRSLKETYLVEVRS
jgi:hypothetical protein